MAKNQEQTKVEETVEAKKETPKSKKETKKSIDQLVKEVIGGAHGTGRERMMSLGDQYEEVQHEVNQLIKKGEI